MGGKTRVPRTVASLLRARRGVLLEVALDGERQPQAVRLGPTGDVPHDPFTLPWPLPARCAHTVVVPHVTEFGDPTQWDAWWGEVHRVAQPGAKVYVSGPYGGEESYAWVRNPRHRIRVVEHTFGDLDPRAEHYVAGRAPFYLRAFTRVPGPEFTTSYNAILEVAPWPSAPS